LPIPRPKFVPRNHLRASSVQFVIFQPLFCRLWRRVMLSSFDLLYHTIYHFACRTAIYLFIALPRNGIQHYRPVLICIIVAILFSFSAWLCRNVAPFCTYPYQLTGRHYPRLSYNRLKIAPDSPHDPVRIAPGSAPASSGAMPQPNNVCAEYRLYHCLSCRYALSYNPLLSIKPTTPCYPLSYTWLANTQTNSPSLNRHFK